MRILILIALSVAFSVAAPAQTLLGNCSGGTVTVQVFNGNVYCTPSSCAGTSLDYSVACNSQYIPAVM